MQFSIFEQKKDNQPILSHSKSFDDFCETLMRIEKEIPDKEQHFLFSPAVYPLGATRGKQNVKQCHMIVYDADDVSCKISDVAAAINPYRAFLYTSYSHTTQHNKFRLIVPLSRAVTSFEYKIVLEEIAKKLGFKFDTAPQHAAALFYMPSYQTGGNGCTFENYSGKVCNPDVLIKQHNKNLNAVKKQQTSNNYFSFTSKLTISVPKSKAKKTYQWHGLFDCPFVKTEKVTEYLRLSHGSGMHYSKMFSFACSIASIAKLKGYPITTSELGKLLIELDNHDGRHHQKHKRDLNKWAENAIKKIK